MKSIWSENEHTEASTFSRKTPSNLCSQGQHDPENAFHTTFLICDTDIIGSTSRNL